MRVHWHSAAKALPFVALFLMALLTTSSARADWGIYQSYIIIEEGSTTTYYGGGINSDNAQAFAGSHLGTVAQGTSLTLNGGELKTWKNGNNGNSNVCGGTLFYRIYPNGSASGDYTGVAFSYAGELGGGNQKWDATSAAIDLASGLSAGDYVVDVWWQAEGNQNGGCGQFQYDSNNGANFQATFTISSAASTSGLFGTPLSTAAHNFATTTTPADAPNPDRWGANLSAPYPTNAWWQDLTLLGQYGYGRVNCFPYQFRAVDNAMEFWLPEISHSGNAVTTSGSANWQFTAAETGLTHQITAYDELSVGVTFSNGSSGTMHMPLVRGMAFASSQYVGLTPKLTTGQAILSIHDAAGASLSQNTPFTGQEFTLALNNGQTWKLYSNQDVTWNWSGGALTSTASASDVWVRMALLNSSVVPVDWPAEYYIGQNQSAIEGLLDAHALAIPIGGSVDATVASDVATLQYNWSHASGSSGNFLIYALPHHQDILTETPSNDMWIRTIRGVMKAVSGESWTLTEPLSTITWNAPRAIPESRKPAIQEALKLSYNFTASNPSIYFGGKQLQGLSRLVLIADELGLTSDVTTFKTQLNSDLSAWLEGTVTYPLYYDTEWGGIIPGPNSSGSDPYYEITFGVDKYNDHHFQYGHLIYAAAVLAKDDPAWVTQHGDVVMQLIRNIATPSHDDPIYPFMRNKDWFVGHSLAAGVGHPDLDGRNQESTSEAVNAWYAVALYGLAIGDDRIRDLGRLMLATELRSSHDYWQIQDADDIYPPAFESNKVVGRLWDAKVDYDTWFGSKTEYIHGIQYLPITPLSEELLRAEWMQEAYPVVSTALADPTLEEWWRSLIYSAHATIAPADAWNETMTLTGFDDGNLPANALHWAATRPNLPEETLATVSSNLATVQFSVDLSQESTVAGPVVKVWVGGAFVDYALTDGDGDGVYTAEASLAMGAYSYKFVNNGVWESIDASHTCAVESGGYYNRQVEVALGQSLFSETLSLPTVCWNSCSDCSEAPTAPESLSITATVCTSASSVQLTGPFWSWQTTSIPAAVDNGDGTWTFTMDMPTVDMEYLLIVDGVQENLIPEASGSCVGVTDYSTYANRQWTVGSGDVTGIVYGTCASTCGVPGCTDATACNYDSTATTDDGSCQGIPAGDCDCDGNQNDACGVCGGSGTDADADGICDDVDDCTDTSACNYAADPTEPCTPCTAESVVFQVDVSDEPYSGELLVYMFGSFQASPWNIASATALQDPDGDGTFSVTIALQAGTTLEYKFLIGDGSYVETLASGTSCTLTTGQYTNRVYTVPTGGATLDAVCFGSCDVCPETGCMDATACNYDSNATSDDGSCVFVVDVCDVCNGDGSVTQPDSDGDGICDASDSCSDTSACNYNDSANGACQTIDACGVCGGSGADVDNDGVCDDSDNCTDTTACNYNDSANGTCQIFDACGVCGGSGTDVDNDGVCDDADNCTDTTACNYNDSANGACQTIDACGVCGGSGTDVDGDGVCDDADNCTDVTACNYNDLSNPACDFDLNSNGICDALEPQDSCIDEAACNYGADATCLYNLGPAVFTWPTGTETGQIWALDDTYFISDIEWDEANGVYSGIFEFTNGTNPGDSFNNIGHLVTMNISGGSIEVIYGGNSVFGYTSETGGFTLTLLNNTDVAALSECCVSDADADGICDDVDTCDGIIDALGVCAGDCLYDTDDDGICDNVDDCLFSSVDALGVCGGTCLEDVDNNGICDVDDIIGCMDANACNYNVDATSAGTCVLPATGYDCSDNCLTDTDQDGVCDEFEVAGCQDIAACNYDPTATDSDGTCTYAASGYDCAGNCLIDVDQDGLCDGVDNCTDTTACNYDDSANGSCQTVDACGVCGGSGTDVDGDGVCDDADNCTDTTACNYNDSANGACQTVDACGVCGGSGTDVDGDGVCDDADNCTDTTACNYNDSANGSCQTVDACGVCGGSGTDVDGDGVCDDVDNCTDTTACNYDDSVNGTCQTLDECGVCGGSGIASGACDCDGNQNDALGVCGGTCAADVDGDGVCDDVDNCTDTTACNYTDSANGTCQTLDECGVCGGSGIASGACDCDGNQNDALGVCGGTCAADADSDGICDDVDDCVGTPDALGVCNGTCTADADNDGICDSDAVPGCTDATACNYNASANVDDGNCTYATTWYADADGDGTGHTYTFVQACTAPAGYVAISGDTCPNDANKLSPGTCGCGNVDVDVDADGLCDTVDGCTDNTACNYDNLTATACLTINTCGNCAAPTTVTCGLQGACNYDASGDCFSDDLCDFDSCAGCMNNTACNYDATATISAPLTCTFPAYAWEDCSGECLNDADANGVCDEVEIPGCMDSAAINYNPNASTDDGSCFTEIVGCIIPSATNYDPAATVQGSPLTTYCTFPPSVPVPWFLMTNPGCMDSNACNYDATATTSDGSCEYTSCQGCDVAGACNYDASVLYNDGSCEWTSCLGCMNSSACDYDATATIADTCDFDSCQGCTNSAASNYDATATQDDGSCIIDGCTNASACNYDATATNNDGSCTYAAAYYDCNGDCNNDTDSDGVCDELEVSGCTNSSACNYDALATDDDASCTLPTTWYQDLDGDGSGDASATQEACVQPIGYVSSAGDNCPSNASKTDPGLCGCSAADVDTDSDGLCDTSDNCTDTTACNYDDSANEACEFATTYYQDADGDGLGNASVPNAVCSDTPPTGYVADSTDNCDNLLADNYNDGGNPACTFASGADYAAQDSLLLCDGGALSIDLDTLHTGSQAGTWSYSLNGALDAFGSATISGSVLTVDGSASGTGRDTLSVSGAGNSETADLSIIVQESTYPLVTGQYLVLPSSPAALDGGVQFTFEGHYDAPVAVHFLHHPTDTTDADGSLILRSDAYWISAFTNDKGCSNPAPATSTTPTESTTPKAMAIPYVLED